MYFIGSIYLSINCTVSRKLIKENMLNNFTRWQNVL